MAAEIISSLTHNDIHDLSHQQRSLLQQICECLEGGVRAGDFTAWSVATEQACLSGFYADECPVEAGPHPIFDLGSLTKPILGGLLFLLAFPEDWTKHLLDRPPFEAMLPEGCANRTELTQSRYLDLFSHQSGLPAWRWFGRGLFHHVSGKRLATLRSDGCTPLSTDRLRAFTDRVIRDMCSQLGQRTVRYSDCGYFILSQLFERDHRILPGGCWRLGLQSLNEALGTQFFHASLSPLLPRLAVPYFPYLLSEIEYIGATLSPGKQFGSVHDTNANILASLNPESPLVSTHAGLFGNACDVRSAARHLNCAWTQNEDDLNRLRNGQDRFSAFLDTPTGEKPLSAAPPAFRNHVYGHLGFTGTSFWFRTRPTNNVTVLLTNRTARRTLARAAEAPRVFTLSTQNSPAFTHATQMGSKILHLKRNDFDELRESSHAMIERRWNDSDCHMAADIAATRRQAGHLLWEFCNASTSTKNWISSPFSGEKN